MPLPPSARAAQSLMSGGAPYHASAAALASTNDSSKAADAAGAATARKIPIAEHRNNGLRAGDPATARRTLTAEDAGSDFGAHALAAAGQSQTAEDACAVRSERHRAPLESPYEPDGEPLIDKDTLPGGDGLESDHVDTGWENAAVFIGPIPEQVALGCRRYVVG